MITLLLLFAVMLTGFGIYQFFHRRRKAAYTVWVIAVVLIIFCAWNLLAFTQ